MVGIKHSVVTAKVNNAAYDVSATAWNAEHTAGAIADVLTDHNKAAHDALSINADLVDGSHAAAFEAAGAAANHAALTTGVHGVGAGTIAKTSDITSDITNHVSAKPHSIGNSTFTLKINGADCEAYNSSGVLTYGGASDAGGINGAVHASVINEVLGDNPAKVFFKSGIYAVGGTSLTPASNVKIVGEGYASQIISTSNIYIFDVNNKTNVSISKLRLTGNAESGAGAGAGVRIQGASSNVEVSHCFIDTLGTAETVGSDIYGIYCDYASHVRIHHNYFNDIAASAVMFLSWDPVANPTVDCIAHHNYAEDCEAGYSFNFGVRDCVYHHNKCYHTVNGCLMENHATYGAPMYCALDHNVFDTSASDMIQVGNSTTDAITSNIRIHGNIIKNVPANKQGIQVSKASINIWINNNEFYAITASCINVGGGSNDLSSDLEIANNIFASGYRGIYFEGNGAAGGCSTSSIHGNRFDTSEYGIQMSGNSDGNSIRNNYFGAIGSGITISAGTCDINFISENDFNACTDDIADSGTGTVFGNNLWKDGSYDTTPP